MTFSTYFPPAVRTFHISKEKSLHVARATRYKVLLLILSNVFVKSHCRPGSNIADTIKCTSLPVNVDFFHDLYFNWPVQISIRPSRCPYFSLV